MARPDASLWPLRAKLDRTKGIGGYQQLLMGSDVI